MKARLRSKLISALPAYLNQTLRGPGRLMVALWLKRDATARAELAQLERLQDAIVLSTRRELPESVLERVRQQIQAETNAASGSVREVKYRRLTPGLASVVIVLLALLAGVVAWIAIPPVIALEWSVSTGHPSEFRIYRARLDEGVNAGLAEFELLNEIPADPTAQPYRYADLQLLPGQRYLYRVDALDASGAVVKSNTTLGDSLGALPGQLVLLGASLVLLYGFTEFAVRGRNYGRWSNNGPGHLRW